MRKVILVILVNLAILVDLVNLVILVIFGLCGLKGHIVEIRWDVTLEDGQRTTECEERARILEQNSQYNVLCTPNKLLHNFLEWLEM